MIAPETLPVAAVALAVDAAIGDPDAIWRRAPHPVAWMAAPLTACERRWNRPERSFARRRAAGLAALVLTLGLAVGAAWAVERALAALPYGWAWTGLVASILIAQRSLHDHVAAVGAALTLGLPEGRRAVARIVGRDPETLDEAGVARAAIESAAENLSDGVTAPLVWLLLFGLPGLALYKAANTADSLIGHRSERFAAFGWAAARLDDGLNLVPARLAALLIALASPRPRAALAAAWTDARRHRSPNAGWPEAAMAGGLGLALGGPRAYGGVGVDGAWLHPAGRRDAGPADLAAALAVLRRVCWAQGLCVLAAAAAYS